MDFGQKTWAKNLPNPGVTVDFVTDIKEITQDILGNTSSLSGAELTKKINENIDAYKKSQKNRILPKYYCKTYVCRK